MPGEKLLKKKNTVSITTGHQLNLFGSPMYFIYKILDVLETSKSLSKKYKKYNFIPIFWMASEDHDFNEINNFKFNDNNMVWRKNTCTGIAKKYELKFIPEIIELANDQLEGSWRLPTRNELESLICQKCQKVKINLKIFPKTPPEPFWTNDKNFWQPKFNWIVNFLNGNTFGRYPGYKPNYIRLVRDRN